MNNLLSRFPKLALPFTILTEKNKVRLIAGEDFRYTFTAPDIDSWAPQILNKLNGKTQVKDLLTEFTQSQQNNIIDLITRLYGERILVDGLTDIPLSQKPYSLKLFGKGLILEKLKENSVESQNQILVLCQEDLNYYELLEFNKMALKKSKPWIWVSYGAMTRGFVSPIFLPQAGSCLACLLDQFQKLSPMPELYQELINYGKENKEFIGVSFPNEGLEILKSLVLWKLALLNKEASQVPIYRLHVLEIESLEVSSHRVFANPECIYCDERY
jgi:hypothetical protein